MSDTTKKNIERATGLTVDRIANMTSQEEQVWIEEQIGRKLVFSKKRNYGKIGRGNPLLARKKIRTADDLERKSRKLFGI